MTRRACLKGHFDLESQAIDADDVQGGQGQVRAHQQDGAATGMVYRDEADEDADGAPQQVGGPEPEPHPLLAIDGAGRLLEPVRRRGCCREESYAVAFDPRDQVVFLGQQPANDVAGGIVGVGHEVERFLQAQ